MRSERARFSSYRNTSLAATLVTIAVLVPTVAWYVAGSRDAVRRSRELAAVALAEVRLQVERDTERVSSRLTALLQREAGRPFYHYQNLYHDPRGVAQGLAVIPSPLAQGTADPLVGAHFQIDPNGTVSLPTVNERFPELSSEDGLAGFCEVLGELQNGLLVTERSSDRGDSDGEDRLLELGWDTWEQIHQADSVYATLKGRRPQAPPPAGGRPNTGGSVVVRVKPLRWQTILLGSGPSLAALREVVTPDGSVVQGFTIGGQAVVDWLDSGAGFSPVVPPGESTVSMPVADTGWYLTTDAGAAINEADKTARQIRRQFMRSFFFGSSAALFAAFAVVMIVVQTDRLARQRAGFAAAAAHELKTPLATLRLHAEMLADGLGDPEHTRSYAERIAPEVRRLGRVVTNMLDLSRLERGVALAHPKPGDLGAAVAECVDRLRPALTAAGVGVELTVDPEIPRVRFDHDGLSQILDNLVDNAEKHTRSVADRRVELGVHSDGSGVIIRIADNGPGIPRRLRHHLFRPFTRHAEQTSGLGLGLAIARSLAVAQGGDLRLVDGDDGAVFEVSLPAA
jgi:signal transduction histidine kinase